MSEDTRYKYEVFKCVKDKCNFICYTLNQLQEHMLDRHATLIVPNYSVNGFKKEK